MLAKFIGISLACILSLQAYTLKESVLEVMSTNPVVQERLNNYRASQQDISIAEAGYYPSLDLSASLGYNQAGSLMGKVPDNTYTKYETSLKLVQNVFDGFATQNRVDYAQAKVLASAYNYLEKSNDIAFKMTSIYLNVLRSYELIQTASENVQINEDIFKKVKDLFDSGLTTDSEVKKIESALSLAKSNLTVQKNNARDQEYSFRRVLGRMPYVQDMIKPELGVAMPTSIDKAALYAINHNPSILVSSYNIESSKALWKEHKKEYYPKIDLEVSQTYNNQSMDNTGFERPDDRFTARIVMNYNLFRGGTDSAIVQQDVSKINQEVQNKRELKRQVVEGLDLSWNAYEMIGLQLTDLREYKFFSEKTLELYKEEYDLGRRSLLDLLSAQNDVINSRSQIITAEYDQLFAKYRVLDAMGLLPLAILGSTKELTSTVNLFVDTDVTTVLDMLPINLDVDRDNLVDNEDLCDNSLKANNIMPSGCKKIIRDGDKDGILDNIDECQLTPQGAKIYPNGCAIDIDMDRVKDYKDECSNTPRGYKVNQKGCATSIVFKVRYRKSKLDISPRLDKKLADFEIFMREHPEVNARVIEEDEDSTLAKSRAESFKNALVKYGIDASRIETEGRDTEDVGANPYGANQSTVIEIELFN